VVYLGVALLCAATPLLNYLGYEFSLAMAIAATAVAGPSAISIFRKTPAGSLRPALLRVLLLHLALLLIPLGVIAANALFVKNCSWPQGLAFFLLLPGVTVLFAVCLGFLLAVVASRPTLLYAAIVTATLIYALASGYFTPAIYSYNLFYGFFPGLTYDETMGVGTPLVTFRLFTVALATLLVWLGIVATADPVRAATPPARRTFLWKRLTSPDLRLRVLLAFLPPVLFYYERTALGWESTAGSIRDALGARHTTEHFTIYYPADVFDDDAITRVGREHEFRLAQLARFFALEESPRVESYLYRSSEEKQRLVGAGSTNIAKPWSGEIHMTAGAMDGVLKHELAHVLAAPFGAPVIGASLSTGLTEGVAMAVEWDWGNRTLHRYAAAMRDAGVLPDVSGMMTLAGFALHSSSVSYVAAGSFCRHLIDRHGMPAMTRVYRSLRFDAEYGKPLPALVEEWQRFLDSIEVTGEDRLAVDALFRRPPIFRKVCARVVAERNREAGKLFAAGDYPRAAALYGESFTDGRGEDALAGWLSASLLARDFDGVLAVYDSVILPDPRPAQYLPQQLTAGLAFWGKGEIDSARTCFARLARADLQEGLTEAALVRLAALEDERNRGRFLEYYLSAAEDSVRLATLDGMDADSAAAWLPLYSRGKILARMGRHAGAVQAMDALAGAPMPPLLHAIRLKTSGRAHFLLGDLQAARRDFGASLDHAPGEFPRLAVEDWMERIAFEEARR
jgi:hypothetical protein